MRLTPIKNDNLRAARAALRTCRTPAELVRWFDEWVREPTTPGPEAVRWFVAYQSACRLLEDGSSRDIAQRLLGGIPAIPADPEEALKQLADPEDEDEFVSLLDGVAEFYGLMRAS